MRQGNYSPRCVRWREVSGLPPRKRVWSGLWLLSSYTKFWLNPARSYHRQVKEGGIWSLSPALRPKTRSEGVQCDKKLMPYHTFIIGGAQWPQAFFGPVRWIKVSLMAISKTAGASYQQTNAPGSMHRPLPAGHPPHAPLPRSKSIPKRTAHSFLNSHTLKLRFVVVMDIKKNLDYLYLWSKASRRRTRRVR